VVAQHVVHVGGTDILEHREVEHGHRVVQALDNARAQVVQQLILLLGGVIAASGRGNVRSRGGFFLDQNSTRT
jgi:hypothetical protein